jgi:hypothetical protein
MMKKAKIRGISGYVVVRVLIDGHNIEAYKKFLTNCLMRFDDALWILKFDQAYEMALVSKNGKGQYILKEDSLIKLLYNEDRKKEIPRGIYR